MTGTGMTRARTAAEEDGGPAGGSSTSRALADKVKRRRVVPAAEEDGRPAESYTSRPVADKVKRQRAMRRLFTSCPFRNQAGVQ